MRQSAERVIPKGHHKERTELGVTFGATDAVAERGDEGIARVRELAGGLGARNGLEAVGFTSLFGPNLTLTAAWPRVCEHIKGLLPAIVEGTADPGRVFDRSGQPGSGGRRPPRRH